MVVQPLFEDVQGSNLHQCSECTEIVYEKVHGHKSPTIVHFKGNTRPRCKSLFASEKSANVHYRRNLKRKFCAKPRGPDASVVPFKTISTESAQEHAKKKEDKALHAANAFWSLWIHTSKKSRGEQQRRKQLWRPWNKQQIVPKANTNKKKPLHPMGSRRVTLAAGLLNALSMINLAKADERQETIIARQGQLLAIVNKPSVAKQRDMLVQLLEMHTPLDQLPRSHRATGSKAKKAEKYLLSLASHTWSPLHRTWDFIHTALMCTRAQLQQGPPPRRPQMRAL